MLRVFGSRMCKCVFRYIEHHDTITGSTFEIEASRLLCLVSFSQKTCMSALEQALDRRRLSRFHQAGHLSKLFLSSGVYHITFV